MTGLDKDQTVLGDITLTGGGTSAANDITVQDMTTGIASTVTYKTQTHTADFADFDDEKLAAQAALKGAESGDVSVQMNASGTKYQMMIGKTILAEADYAADEVTVIFEDDAGNTILSVTPKAVGTNWGTADAMLPLKVGKLDTGITYQAPVGAGDVINTWNVCTTNNVQGNETSDSDLASTIFTLDKSKIVDGGSIPLGDTTYTFAVGKDSAYKGADTVVDLTQHEADSDELLHQAGELLSRAAKDNAAFSEGHQGNGVISLHENKGQTDYQKGELNTLEGFEKVVSYHGVQKEGSSLKLQIGIYYFRRTRYNTCIKGGKQESAHATRSLMRRMWKWVVKNGEGCYSHW